MLVLTQIALEHDNLAGARHLAGLVRASGYNDAWLCAIEARLALAAQDAPAARAAALDAVTAGTDEPHIAAQIGVVLARTGLHEEATRLFDQAVIGAPGNLGYLYNYAIELQFAGRLEEARTAFEKLVESKPDHAQAWLALVGLAPDPPEAWRAELEKQFSAATETERLLLFGHALARWHEAHGNWDQSLVWLDRAKARKAGEVAHDRAVADRLFSAAANSIRPDIDTVPRQDERPIFVTGLPRSGTTLVERIIAAHPAVRSLGELSEFGVALKRSVKTPGAHVLDEASLLAAKEAADLATVGEHYLQLVNGLAGDAERFVDKMPFNIFFAPAILAALPGARVICLRRSPFDTVFANYRQLFATGFSYYSYAYDFADTAHFVAGFERLADSLADQMPPDRFMTVRYEDLVGNQEAETRRLVAFCGLPWSDACLAPERNAQPVATASAVQVRAPVHARSVGSWQRYSEGSERVVRELARYGFTPD